jgi:hypothetical protein
VWKGIEEEEREEAVGFGVRVGFGAAAGLLRMGLEE